MKSDLGDSLVELSKDSSKKRRGKKPIKEIQSRTPIMAKPLFKNSEIQLSDDLLDYINKLEFLVKQSKSRVIFEKTRFAKVLHSLLKYLNINNINYDELFSKIECDSEGLLSEPSDFYNDILKKYEPIINIPSITKNIRKGSNIVKFTIPPQNDELNKSKKPGRKKKINTEENLEKHDIINEDLELKQEKLLMDLSQKLNSLSNPFHVIPQTNISVKNEIIQEFSNKDQNIWQKIQGFENAKK